MGETVEVLSNGSVLFEYGPMRMIIQVSDHGRPMMELAEGGAHKAREVLEDLARFLPVIKKKTQALKGEERYPEVVRRMIEATQKMEEPDLTPLAAVAGTSSDVVADFMIHQGGTKIIIDNGGDIAIRLTAGEVVKVGIKTDISAKQPSYLIAIDETMRIGGVATSGLGGRSFTKGIATAATVLSENASFADAAATVIGNFTNVEDSHIKRSLAENIYPETDIAGEWVTTGMGELSSKKIEEAVNRGLSKANSLFRRGLIRGALIAVKGRVAWTHSLNPWLIRL
ncbi:MAG TPA: UPF0280 family protein [Thermodesulfobacteriota bacterium]|nr:UPF0280 family protein [Thermodesulfobacteriota bacterium]